ncbi:MAG: AAA family ATPase [Candidatus Methanoperedens sp.]|nr:AAA family ATPase [Candidatus Methanoperedens sp.]MCZ7403591.1 AAA family ATPase [Candidatus Methanoperedens sp.]
MKTKYKLHTEIDEIERVPIQRNELMNEIDLIDRVYETILKNGFTFSREQVINYYLSLKTKPFVILTGISGTGKTKITELFARAVCQDYDKQYLQLPVRPDWNDDRNLLGYYNPLTKQYLSTPFLKFIMNAVQDSENPYFLCLDEMNLARVEYYFSTFLSAMESTKKIKLHGENNIKTENGLEIPAEIEIPINLFFTGTVNMDETTYRFSPKVLDRANTIEFNEIKLLTPRVTEDTSAINSELIEPFKTYFLNDKVRKNGTSSEYKKWETENWTEMVGFLDHVNKDALEKYNLHFGYRIRDEVMRYLYFTEELNSDDFTTNIALDLQIKQKILPRIKGTDSIKKALELMRDIIQDKLQSIEKPQSIPKLDQMMGALDNGYTDFYQ